MDYKRRSLELCDELIRRPLLICCGIRPWSALELPDVEPQFLCRPESGDGIEHSVVRDHALETSCVAEQPVDRVSTVGCAESTLALLIDERICLLEVIKAIQQVHNWLAAPITVDTVNEFLTVTSRTARINQDYNIAAGSHQFRIPAIRPLLAPLPLRSAVDQKLHRILLPRVETGRLEEKTLHFCLLCADELERFKRRHRNL